MRKLSLLLLIFVLPFCVMAQNIIIGSYNLRYDSKSDTGNLWKNRLPVVAALIRFHEFDIIGTQEGLRNQLDDIKTQLPEFDYYGAGRDDGKIAGEHSAIFFKKERFIKLDSGDFWLSETPGQPSLGWDAKCCKRLCSWVRLKDNKSKKIFYVFNAHYDHEGKTARIESSKLIIKKIKEIAGESAVIFTGDLNGGHDTECYKIIAGSGFLTDTYTKVEFPYLNNGSFNGFGKTLDQTAVIDHMFVSKQFSVDKWGVLTDSYHGRYPSDHFPVITRISYK